MGTGEETKRGVCVFPQEIILNRTEQNWSHRVEFQSSSSHWLPGLPGSMFPSKRQRVAVAAAARADRLFPSEPGAGGTRNKGWSVANRQGVLGPMVATPLKSKVHRDPTTPPPLWGCSDDVLARGPGTRWRPDSCRCDSQGMGINKPRPPLAMPQLRPGLCSSSAACSCIRNCPRIFVCISMSRGGFAPLPPLPSPVHEHAPAKLLTLHRRHDNRTPREVIHLYGYCSITSVPLPTGKQARKEARHLGRQVDREAGLPAVPETRTRTPPGSRQNIKGTHSASTLLQPPTRIASPGLRPPPRRPHSRHSTSWTRPRTRRRPC